LSHAQLLAIKSFFGFLDLRQIPGVVSTNCPESCAGYLVAAIRHGNSTVFQNTNSIVGYVALHHRVGQVFSTGPDRIEAADVASLGHTTSTLL